MKSSTLVSVLTRLTTALAAIAPVIVFAFLYVLLVQPRREAAVAAQRSLDTLRSHVDRLRLFARRAADVTPVASAGQLEARIAGSDSAAEFLEALAALVKSPGVGGLRNLSIETGAAGGVPADSYAALSGGHLASTPVDIRFDASFEQIGRFFSNLRALPTTYEIRSVDLAPSGRGVMRARVVLLAFHHAGGKPAPVAPRRKPLPTRAAAPPVLPGPRVSSILLATGRRVALIDGRIVAVGDRVGEGVVTAIESEAVILTGADNRQRRLALERPIRVTTRSEG